MTSRSPKASGHRQRGPQLKIDAVDIDAVDDEWFDVDDDELSGEHAALIDVVRGSARSWPACPPSETAVLLFSPEEAADDSGSGANDGHASYDVATARAFADGKSVLVLIVDLSDPVKNLLLRTLGATVAGDRLFCGERDDTTYRPQPSEDVEPLESTGSPEELGHIAAAWFEEIVRRPVIAPPGRGPAYFVTPGAALPAGHRWVRNGPAAV
ncbi:hypothetical protein ACH4TV_39545 [Streptomyces sp. NPDC020898]|uniref:hypothetical protein n=1 Tax=Streptomyces sp. NPDC020898 TaxID=3365101 RepID=UPI00379290DD